MAAHSQEKGATSLPDKEAQPIPTHITLLPAEQRLRDLLLACRNFLLTQPINTLPHLDLYIVGGWVRDRLLGRPSHDIDIALSSMTGIQFARALNNFAAQQSADSAASKLPRFHEVPQNPAMSKKLDTAVGKAFGLDVDLVNLRREIYDDDDDTRQPTMSFGTAAEDAARRDATVNALFVDLQTLEVLDLTGRGLRDLREGVMRTPLGPRQTFLDDPLRVLRLIRIGCQLGFRIEEEALEWMGRGEIHDALERKVRRERMSVETIKMLEGATPEDPLQVIFEADLYASVFLSSRSSVTAAMARVWPRVDGQPWPQSWPRAYRMLAEAAGQSQHHGLGRLIPVDRGPVAHSWDCARARLWLMAIYAPVACGRYQDASLKEAVEEIKSSVSLKSRAVSLLTACLRNIDSITATVERISTRPTRVTRSMVGMAIRTWGETWRLQVLFALLASLVLCEPSLAEEAITLHDIRKRFERFVDVVEEQKLWDADSVRPLLDGRALMGVLGTSKGGSYLKTALDDMVAFQFDKPDAQIEEVTSWAVQHRDKWLGNET